MVKKKKRKGIPVEQCQPIPFVSFILDFNLCFSAKLVSYFLADAIAKLTDYKERVAAFKQENRNLDKKEKRPEVIDVDDDGEEPLASEAMVSGFIIILRRKSASSYFKENFL